MPGLYLVIQPSGKQSWAYRYRLSGRPRKWTIGPCPAIDLKTARELAREALRKVAAGADPCTEKKAAKAAARMPVGIDLIETVTSRFVAQHAKRKLKAATAWEIERLLEKEVVAPWRGRRLSQIGRADIHDLLDGIVARGSPVTANRTLAWLRRMCAWAIERGLIEVSPCAGIRAPAAETSRDRVLSDDELKAVWRAADALESRKKLSNSFLSTKWPAILGVCTRALLNDGPGPTPTFRSLPFSAKLHVTKGVWEAYKQLLLARGLEARRFPARFPLEYSATNKKNRKVPA